MILPKSVNLLSSALGAPFMPERLRPPGGPLLPARPAGPPGPPGRPSPPGVLWPIWPSVGLGGPPGPARLAARPKGPALGPWTFLPPPRACDRRRADIDVAFGLGTPPNCGDGAAPDLDATSCTQWPLALRGLILYRYWEIELTLSNLACRLAGTRTGI